MKAPQSCMHVGAWHMMHVWLPEGYRMRIADCTQADFFCTMIMLMVDGLLQVHDPDHR